MRVLWITNMLLPEMQAHLGIKEMPYGGWMSAAAESLARKGVVVLAVASVSNLVDKVVRYELNGIFHYAIPMGGGNIKYNSEYEQYWRYINQQFRPDIVHIHGTEFSHGLSYVKACGADNVVVSIQGLVSVIQRYCYGGISTKEFIRNLTLRDILNGTSVFKERTGYKKRGKLEVELLNNVKHIIGRTSWDRAHVWSINPNASYYIVNESLRSPFYNGHWKYDNCEPHTIFLSQGGSALKGAHKVLQALPLVKKHYPDTKVYIAGKDIVSKNGLLSCLKTTNYSCYIRRLVEKLGIINNIEFVGVLSEEEMKDYLLKANLFICPSSIENSPNSLGEAQILGVPCIASFVGGIPDMMTGFGSCLYEFDDVEMLAKKICEVFSNIDNQFDMSEIAKKRHNKINNTNQLLEVYKRIIIR